MVLFYVLIVNIVERGTANRAALCAPTGKYILQLIPMYIITRLTYAIIKVVFGL